MLCGGVTSHAEIELNFILARQCQNKLYHRQHDRKNTTITRSSSLLSNNTWAPSVWRVTQMNKMLSIWEMSHILDLLDHDHLTFEYQKNISYWCLFCSFHTNVPSNLRKYLKNCSRALALLDKVHSYMTKTFPLHAAISRPHYFSKEKVHIETSKMSSCFCGY